ncbi:MAG: diaminopimelate decarboxylase [Leptonema sp. (in: Bacteria)]|nr:diaminopimelate decarboxylase [Leptonema sp. (in: bacteria)]
MLPGFEYINNHLLFSSASLQEISKEFGTPLYLYSESIIIEQFNRYKSTIQDRNAQVHFAVKSNSNLSILKILAQLGAGADIVSGGELYRSLKAGIPASKVVFSGVGKTDQEIEYAIESNIMLFSVESKEELIRISEVATKLKRQAPVSLRINPDVDAKTHPYISTGLKENKFGLPFKEFGAMIDVALSLSNISLLGFGFHIGSQLTDLAGFEEAAKRGLELSKQFILKVGNLRYLDVGGGLGIQYENENPPKPDEYVNRMLSILNLPDTTILFEPGRSIVGSAGLLLTKVLYRKQNESKSFYICDAAMNDLIRPSLYSAYHQIYAVNQTRQESTLHNADLVGPVCETGDFLARNRALPNFEQNDLIAVATTGAYGFTMSSNYNSRPRPAEVLIGRDGGVRLIRRRESYNDLIATELDFV